MEGTGIELMFRATKGMIPQGRDDIQVLNLGLSRDQKRGPCQKLFQRSGGVEYLKDQFALQPALSSSVTQESQDKGLLMEREIESKACHCKRKAGDFLKLYSPVGKKAANRRGADWPKLGAWTGDLY